MSFKIGIENTAKATWARSGRELPSYKDDAALIELIDQAKAGDDVAIAGLLLVMSKCATNAIVGHAWAMEQDPFGLSGKAAAMSMLWIAVEVYDSRQHTSRVAKRLTADIRYMARQPTRGGDSTYAVPMAGEAESLGKLTEAGVFVGAQLYRTADDLGQRHSNVANDAFAMLEEQLWLEQACDNADLPKRERDLARELLTFGGTDREVAESMNIPVGSIARTRKVIRDAIAHELVA